MRILTFEAKSDRKHWRFKLRLAKYRLLEVEPNFANQVSSKYNSPNHLQVNLSCFRGLGLGILLTSQVKLGKSIL